MSNLSFLREQSLANAEHIYARKGYRSIQIIADYKADEEIPGKVKCRASIVGYPPESTRHVVLADGRWADSVQDTYQALFDWTAREVELNEEPKEDNRHRPPGNGSRNHHRAPRADNGFRHLLLAMISTSSEELIRSENASFIFPDRHDLKLVVGLADEEDYPEYYADLVRQDENKDAYYVVVDGGSSKTLNGAYKGLLRATARKIDRLRMEDK